MLLLIQSYNVRFASSNIYLQYTLLLLIPIDKAKGEFLDDLFTIHFATINTKCLENYTESYYSFTIHFATINTIHHIYSKQEKIQFTIHFATINTKDKYKNEFEITHLQYTLLLLILEIIFIYKK